jgi:hypothetical protein
MVYGEDGTAMMHRPDIIPKDWPQVEIEKHRSVVMSSSMIEKHYEGMQKVRKTQKIG